jgi:Fe-S cluster biogenesis protein NfuA
VQSGRPTPLTTPRSAATPGADVAIDGAVRERVLKVLELIRPAVQSDGGDIEFVDLTDDGVVQIRFHGACVGCPSSQVTLQVGVERNLKTYVPQVRSVQAVD